jgi:hypothetical protein
MGRKERKFALKFAFKPALFTAAALSLAGFFAGTPAPAAEPDAWVGEREQCVAVAYTAEDFSGVPWKIFEAGEYDLQAGFGLPNDSIFSIRVMPGYRVTLYEHSGFKGRTGGFYEDTGDLARWARQASSLKVEKVGNVSEGAAYRWLSAANEPGKFAESRLSGRNFALELNKWREVIERFDGVYRPRWYGATTDAGRVEAGSALLALFETLGYDVSGWAPNAPGNFTRMMNNFFDWRRDLSVWRVACMVLNIDAEAFR